MTPELTTILAILSIVIAGLSAYATFSSKTREIDISDKNSLRAEVNSVHIAYKDSTDRMDEMSDKIQALRLEILECVAARDSFKAEIIVLRARVVELEDGMKNRPAVL